MIDYPAILRNHVINTTSALHPRKLDRYSLLSLSPLIGQRRPLNIVTTHSKPTVHLLIQLNIAAESDQQIHVWI